MSEMHAVTPVNNENFEQEVMQSTAPVVVEFWTEGCRPCRKLGTIIRQYTGRLKVAPCNVDESPDIAARYSVLTIPTLLFFKNGEVVDSAMGTFNDIDEAEVAGKCARFLGDAQA